MRPQSGTVKTQTLNEQRKFKYAHINDTEACEREVNRMLSVISHVVYSSGKLLEDHFFRPQVEETVQKSFVSQNAMTKSTALRQQKKKGISLGEQLISLIGQILEQISIKSVVEECLQCMVTMASQNRKFKSAFLLPCQSLVGSKRNTVMKIVVDAVLKEQF